MEENFNLRELGVQLGRGAALREAKYPDMTTDRTDMKLTWQIEMGHMRGGVLSDRRWKASPHFAEELGV